MGLTVAAEAEHHGVFTANFVAEVSANEDARKGDCAEEELVLSGLEYVRVLYNGRDDGSREDAIGEGDAECLLISNATIRRKIVQPLCENGLTNHIETKLHKSQSDLSSNISVPAHTVLSS